MTPTLTDLVKRLREAMEKATQGIRWATTPSGRELIARFPTYDMYLFPPIDDDALNNLINNLAYIALASPANMRVLLDGLERLTGTCERDQIIAELDTVKAQLATSEEARAVMEKALEWLCIGTCSCGKKAPDPEIHDPCHYGTAARALLAVRSLNPPTPMADALKAAQERIGVLEKALRELGCQRRLAQQRISDKTCADMAGDGFCVVCAALEEKG